MKTRGDGQTALFACQKNDCLIHFDWLFDAATYREVEPITVNTFDLFTCIFIYSYKYIF